MQGDYWEVWGHMMNGDFPPPEVDSPLPKISIVHMKSCTKIVDLPLAPEEPARIDNPDISMLLNQDH